MKTYIFEITIKEGSDEFWEQIKDEDGIKEVAKDIKAVLEDSGYVNTTVKLKKYVQEE